MTSGDQTPVFSLVIWLVSFFNARKPKASIHIIWRSSVLESGIFFLDRGTPVANGFGQHIVISLTYFITHILFGTAYIPSAIGLPVDPSPDRGKYVVS
jgi:hypothetical protein